MLRRRFLSLSAAAFLPRRRPNLIVFMTDDHGPWATGFSGCSEIATPHLNRLAQSGCTFTHAYAATPVCSPSRMTYMTGLLPSHHGVQDWLIPQDAFGPRSRRWLAGKTTYPEILAAAGYRMGMTGKWHMGHDDQAQCGFSYWATVPGGGGTFKDARFIRNGQPVPTTGFKEDAIGNFALEFLDQQKNSPDPFFLLVPFYAPHTPYDYQPEAARRPYENAKFGCYPTPDRHPWQNPGLARHHRNAESMRAYSALITGMDSNVGRILEAVDRMGARENTTVLFTADQGWNAGHHGVWGKGNGTVPFNMYEESIGVPMAWSHPGRIPENRRAEAMVSSYDLFPTLLDWLGLKAPADPRRPGRSYARVLQNPQRAHHNQLLFEYSYVRALRTKTEKLIERTPDWPSEYYDLQQDPGETRNQWDARPAALQRRLHQTFQKLGAPPLAQWRTTTQQNLTVYTRQE